MFDEVLDFLDAQTASGTSVGVTVAQSRPQPAFVAVHETSPAPVPAPTPISIAATSASKLTDSTKQAPIVNTTAVHCASIAFGDALPWWMRRDMEQSVEEIASSEQFLHIIRSKTQATSFTSDAASTSYFHTFCVDFQGVPEIIKHGIVPVDVNDTPIGPFVPPPSMEFKQSKSDSRTNSMAPTIHGAVKMRAPLYEPVNSVPLPFDKSTRGVQAAVGACFNCGGSHPVRDCTLPPDRFLIQCNTRLFNEHKTQRKPQTSARYYDPIDDEAEQATEHPTSGVESKQQSNQSTFSSPAPAPSSNQFAHQPYAPQSHIPPPPPPPPSFQSAPLMHPQGPQHVHPHQYQYQQYPHTNGNAHFEHAPMPWSPPSHEGTSHWMNPRAPPFQPQAPYFPHAPMHPSPGFQHHTPTGPHQHFDFGRSPNQYPPHSYHR